MTIASPLSCTTLTVHPVAEMMPGLNDAELESLKAGISRDGQLVPILVLNNQIIDGRHRYWACRELGIEPRVTEWTGPTDTAGLIECAIAVNVHRRHLTVSQRSALAADALPFFEEQARERMLATLKRGEEAPDKEEIPERERGQSRDKVAAMFAVNPKYVSYAKAIKERSIDTFTAMKNGDIDITSASRLVIPKPEKPTPPEPAATPVSLPVAVVQPVTPPSEPTVQTYPQNAPEVSIPSVTELTPPFGTHTTTHNAIPNPVHTWEPYTNYALYYDGDGWHISAQ